MPVRIRHADCHVAMFSVSAPAAQQLIDYSGLRVCEYLPGKAVVMLMLVRYHDGDLGRYNEFGTAVMVNPAGANARGPAALRNAAAFIHHLPVDQSFTLEAGRTIWGFPKIMADFTVREGSSFGFEVAKDGKLIAGVDFASGVPLPSALTSKPQTLRTYSCLDGVTREIPWEMRNSGMRVRVGGARLRLGDHPYAADLASLGLPKRAMASQSSARVQMTFGDAHVVTP
ncbi:acetoacetate decarboxylase family protein [Mycobacterium sp. MYCO198283]|uniref:acetoacetate decarboxylase family protein n=1 Tax=Mycobacterium sp. MYCO198283 TaxID=2883505 RepID=UPI001E4DFEF1|nr:acetoacetate decarboxylase family protein [Mycobacterium sp. MYCO198283]MCG5431359.1 acetoacetate decarboxylase family protein [Mycobacterium sp. MYCO198283]